jgi:hypothetical protein
MVHSISQVKEKGNLFSNKSSLDLQRYGVDISHLNQQTSLGDGKRLWVPGEVPGSKPHETRL